MFDPSSEPNYSPGMDNYGPQNYDSNGMQMPKVDIKRYLPMLVGIGILLIIGFFLLNWLGSQKNIEISLVDTDGNPVTGSLTLRDESGKSVELTPKGKARVFKATLFPGDYIAKVTAENYKPLEGEIISITNATDPSKPQELVLKRNLNATLTTVIEVTKIYEFQKIEGKLMVFNSGNEFNLTDITYTATAPLKVTLHPTGANTVTIGQTEYIDFSVEVKEGANLTKSVPANIIFKIKGSDIASPKFDITAMPVIKPTEITMTGGPTTTTVGLTAGALKPKEYTIKFKNLNKIVPLDDLKVTIVASSGSEDTLDWLRISDPDDAEIPTEKTLPTIDPLKEQTIKLTVDPPFDAKKGDTFEGVIKLTSPALKEEKEFVISFRVDIETTVSAVVKLSQEVFTINCTTSTGTCSGAKTYATGEATIQNNGNIDIGVIELSVNLSAQETTNNCPSYFRLNTTRIDGLKVGEKRDLSFDIFNAPESPDRVEEVCIIEWKYANPLDLSLNGGGRLPIKITKKTV